MRNYINEPTARHRGPARLAKDSNANRVDEEVWARSHAPAARAILTKRSQTHEQRCGFFQEEVGARNILARVPPRLRPATDAPLDLPWENAARRSVAYRRDEPTARHRGPAMLRKASDRALPGRSQKQTHLWPQFPTVFRNSVATGYGPEGTKTRHREVSPTRVLSASQGPQIAILQISKSQKQTHRQPRREEVSTKRSQIGEEIRTWWARRPECTRPARPLIDVMSISGLKPG
jgi:hypothetical protein